MADLNPRAELETHDVSNQPPPFENVNLFEADRAFAEAVRREGAEAHLELIRSLGARAGSAEVAEWATQANRFPPELRQFDRYGQRIDEVRFHPAYHQLMALGLTHRIAAVAWADAPGGHVAHAALLYLMSQAEPGVCCPMTMTYAALPALRHAPVLAADWGPRIMAAQYDPTSAPREGKNGVTLGMAMTEKQGGSDLRTNTTLAHALGSDGTFELVGHKWFCSAPMCDAFLTLANTDKGLTCFLVPRWRPDGTRNAIHVMRLKDKLGDRANASSEIEYHGAYAELVGEEGRGIRTIIEMVHHTRLDCTVAPAALMRQAVANALWHTAHRTAFQRRLIDQPLMREVLADLAIEAEAATLLAFRLARSFDEAETSEAAALFGRIATPVAKYWLNKRVVGVVAEAMEAHGGAGYIEEGVMPRLFRQSPLNSIWEGSGNVISLDVLRAFSRDATTIDAFLAELEEARGAHKEYDRRLDALSDWFVSGQISEATARRFVEELALLLQASLLLLHSSHDVADAFCGARLGGGGLAFGTLPPGTRIDPILERAMPAV